MKNIISKFSGRGGPAHGAEGGEPVRGVDDKLPLRLPGRRGTHGIFQILRVSKFCFKLDLFSDGQCERNYSQMC